MTEKTWNCRLGESRHEKLCFFFLFIIVWLVSELTVPLSLQDRFAKENLDLTVNYLSALTWINSLAVFMFGRPFSLKRWWHAIQRKIMKYTHTPSPTLENLTLCKISQLLPCSLDTGSFQITTYVLFGVNLSNCCWTESLAIGHFLL